MWIWLVLSLIILQMLKLLHSIVDIQESGASRVLIMGILSLGVIHQTLPLANININKRFFGSLVPVWIEVG